MVETLSMTIGPCRRTGRLGDRLPGRVRHRRGGHHRQRRDRLAQCPVEVKRCADQREVGEGLWEISELFTGYPDLFRVES
jgi:hypothetical protein